MCFSASNRYYYVVCVFRLWEKKAIWQIVFHYACSHTHLRVEWVRNTHMEKWLHPFWTFSLHFLHQWKAQCVWGGEGGESEKSLGEIISFLGQYWLSDFFARFFLSLSGSRILLFFLLFLWRKFSIHCVCRIEWLSDNVITLAVLYEEEIVWLIRALQLK